MHMVSAVGFVLRGLARALFAQEEEIPKQIETHVIGYDDMGNALVRDDATGKWWDLGKMKFYYDKHHPITMAWVVQAKIDEDLPDGSTAPATGVYVGHEDAMIAEIDTNTNRITLRPKYPRY